MPDVQIVSLESHRSSYGTSFWNAPEKRKKKAVSDDAFDIMGHL